jgi:hypothetical protein
MASVYKAHQLQFDRSTNIRVIRLLPRYEPDLDAPICCELHIVSLSESPKFFALSYVWGSEDTTRTIILDNKPFVVRLNLWNFLAEYRRIRGHEYLWVDALCIDQLNIAERNHQVGLMAQIYSTAEKTIVWLGIELRSSLYALACNLPKWHLVLSLKEVCASDYWDRLWIVQEFILSRRIELWSKAARLDGDVFCSRFDFRPSSMPDTLREGESGETLHMYKSSNARNIAYQRAHNVRISGFFGEYSLSKCADPRDRIYGLLGVLNETRRDDYPIHPDYSKSASMLFLEVWTMWLKSILQEDRNCNGQAIWENNMRRNISHLQDRLELPCEDRNVTLALADLEERKKKFPNSSDWVQHIKALHAESNKRLATMEKWESRVRKVYWPLRKAVERFREDTTE